MKKIALVGSTGKMGSILSSLIEKDSLFSLTLKLHSASSFEASLFSEIDLLFDFSLPSSLSSYLSICLEKQIPLVIGTTGFSSEQEEAIQKASCKIPIFFSPNFSIGIALTTFFGKKASSFFSKVSIEEKHHIHKKDTPSGTALFLQKEISPSSSISSIREKEVFGEHTLFFTSSQETLTIKHRALSREVFAEGALKAAHFLLQQKPGLYSMKELVNIEAKPYHSPCEDVCLS